MISTIIIFLLVLTLLIAVHEMGHFLAAKLFGIRVDEFAIGFYVSSGKGLLLAMSEKVQDV